MPKIAKELNALTVGRLKKQGSYAVGKVAGLYLNVGANPQARNWTLCVMTATGRREFGLGAYPALTLADAHKKAQALKDTIKAGIDPVAESKANKSRAKAAKAKNITFTQLAADYIAAKEHEWRNPKHRDQWANTLNTYAAPFIGELIVKDIDRAHVIAALSPIWLTKTETATRLRGRIEKILDYAKSLDLRTGDNPAAWKGGLESVLAKPSKVKQVEHHAALNHAHIGIFMVQLKGKEGAGARCLEFCILTATRSGEARGATWAEFDLDAALWTIPAQRMKAGKAHTVPLSTQALALLRTMPRFTTDYVFPSTKQGQQLSDMTLTAVLRRMGAGVTAHGFRSTFRDWAANCTTFDRQTCEHALAHQLPNKVEAAYQRSTMLEKRKALMQAWADRCDTLDITQNS